MNREPFEISVEIFNLCGGGCTGCAITPQERRSLGTVVSAEEFARAARQIAEHGKRIDVTFRPAFCFGDIPLLDRQVQRMYYDACRENGMPFAITITLATPGVDDQYMESIDLAVSYGDVILDLTLDPFRYVNHRDYADRVKTILSKNDNNHVQVLLSESVIGKIDPNEMDAIVKDATGDGRAVLVYVPTTSNMDKRQYRYPVGDALRYAKKFYSVSRTARAQAEDELREFSSRGDFFDHVQTKFHIGNGLNVYAVAISPFGDVILDERNGHAPIGNLQSGDLSSILKGSLARRLGIKNQIEMVSPKFECEACEWLSSCSFMGVGLIRDLYSDFEQKRTSCYGPMDLMRSA